MNEWKAIFAATVIVLAIIAIDLWDTPPNLKIVSRGTLLGATEVPAERVLRSCDLMNSQTTKSVKVNIPQGYSVQGIFPISGSIFDDVWVFVVAEDGHHEVIRCRMLSEDKNPRIIFNK